MPPLTRWWCPALSMAVSLSLDDIAQFGDGSRELFIKSSCYSAITVAVGDCGPAISWIFSSEPKSISFSVLYRESEEVQVENSKVRPVVLHFYYRQKMISSCVANSVGLGGRTPCYGLYS